MEERKEQRKANAEHVDSDGGSDNEVTERRGQYRKRKKIPVNVRLDNEGHYARLSKSNEVDTIRNRGGCRMCKTKVSTKCHKCDAFLCIDSTGDSTCFEKFHTEENIA
jgi:hypothetical protein